MASGRSIVIVMGLLGIALLGGYEMLRRSATPHEVAQIDDQGKESGEFDRIYHFLNTRYRVRQGPDEKDAPIGTVIVSTLADDESDRVAISRTRVGWIDNAFLLELDKDAPPKVVVTFRSPEANAAAEGVVYSLEGEEWRSKPLEPLPRELLDRYLGEDRYEQQGAFLYRTITLDPRVTDGPTLEEQLFYDFHNERWQVVQ